MIEKVSVSMRNFLEALGRKVGLNLLYFVGNGFWVTCRYVVIAAAGLVVSIAFSRLGTKELLGQYQFVLSFLAFVSIFSLPGLNVSVLKSISKKQDAGIIRAVKLSFLSSLIGMPIVIFYGLFRFFQDADFILGLTLILSGVLFAFYYAPNTWYAFYEGKSLFRPVSIRMMLVSMITSAGLVAGLYFGVNVLWLILIYLLFNTLFHWLFFFETIKKIKRQKKRFFGQKIWHTRVCSKICLWTFEPHSTNSHFFFVWF